MTSSSPAPNPNPVPTPPPNPTPNATPAIPASSPPKDQQQLPQTQDGVVAGLDGGGGSEPAEVPVAGEAMEVDGGVGGTGAADGEGGGAGGGVPHGTSSPAIVFRIRLKQPPESLRHKMRVPELCRNFRFAPRADSFYLRLVFDRNLIRVFSFYFRARQVENA
jgi:hypothetical protein